MQAQDALNLQYKEATASDDRMHYLDCGAQLLSTKNTSCIDRELMPDALHPNDKGAPSIAASSGMSLM